MEITLLLNNPLGGRCRLYREYATILIGQIGFRYVETYDTLAAYPEARAPSLLINGKLVSPSDGVILSPGDIIACLPMSPMNKYQVESLLESVRVQSMQEWNQ